MPYFTKDFLDFFRDLKQNNEREWYHANKDRYYESVKNPFKDFVAHMIDRLTAIDPHMLTTPKEAIFRLARDTRFSKDKTPYKTHTSAVIGQGGRKGMKIPGLYLQFNDEQLGLYSGIYQPAKEDLQPIREEIASNPDEFTALLEDSNFVANTGGEIEGDKNKRIPKEFKEAAEQQPLIFNKSFLYKKHLPAGHILSDELPDMLIDYYMAIRPMNQFLTRAVTSEA